MHWVQKTITMDLPVPSPPKRFFLTLTHRKLTRRVNLPNLAPLAVNEEPEIDADVYSLAYSFLPSPPLRVANAVCSENAVRVPERAYSVPQTENKILKSLQRQVHSWSEPLGRPIPKASPSHSHSHSHSPANSGAERISHESGLVELDELSAAPTMDPLVGMAFGPHQPPFPLEPLPIRTHREPSFFPDPFTEYMEDRMLLFRPTSSQNNVESSLNDTHPYQLQPDSKNTQWNTWFASAAVNSSHNPVEAVENTPARSSNSFLPRNCVSEEPRPTFMEYTPRAEPIGEIRKAPSPELKPVCYCLM